MTPSPPVWPKPFGERAAAIEMFFTPVSAQALAPEFFLTGASTTGGRALRTKRATWSLIIVDLSAVAEKKAALKRSLPALLSRKGRGHGLRKLAGENPPCSNLPV